MAFTVDGPRGPGRPARCGLALGATGHPVLPLHIEASRYWSAELGSGMIPKPFAAVAIAIGDPFDVPGTDAETVERSRMELMERLASLQRTCESLLTS